MSNKKSSALLQICGVISFACGLSGLMLSHYWIIGAVGIVQMILGLMFIGKGSLLNGGKR